jgi:ATP-dependent Clp protease ATP-binding subunit ClpB
MKGWRALLEEQAAKRGAVMAQINITLDPMQTSAEAKSLEAELRARVVGQDAAIEQIVGVYQMHLTGLVPPGRPIANFLFLGPTGSGKTRIVEAVAESLVHNPRAVLKIDCAEFRHSHEVAKLIGSPPGYLGHRETHPLLSQEMLNQHHTDTMKISLVLFDESKKQATPYGTCCSASWTRLSSRSAITVESTSQER